MGACRGGSTTVIALTRVRPFLAQRVIRSVRGRATLKYYLGCCSNDQAGIVDESFSWASEPGEPVHTNVVTENGLE